MDSIFSIGIQSLWDELRHMPVGGVWWINTDRNEDAVSLVNQTIAAQTKDARVAVITMGEEPKKIIRLEDDRGPQTVKLFSMSTEADSLYFLPRDIQCTIDPDHYLVVLKCSNNALQNIPAEKLLHWLEKINRWAKNQNCTVLVVNPGSNNDKLFSLLMGEYRSLFGLASIRDQTDSFLYDIAFWCNEKGVSARQQLTLKLIEGNWHVAQQEETVVQPRSDEKRILSQIAVLEGAPALSENWSLFETNEALFNEARTTQAATIVFSLMQNNQIETLARQIHT
ncbi:cellulose biosynthesis protein BcsE, partial [Enterobacter sp. 63]